MTQLRIPGPTPCPPEVLEATARQMVDQRGVDFKKILLDTTEKLKQVFETKNDVFILTGSGTGGLEAAAVNMLSPGDKVLSVSIGVFGERWASIVKAFGAEIVPCKVEWGWAADPAVVAQHLKDNPDVKAVLVTHNETSTGVTNPLQEIARVVKDAGKLIMVDAISSMGSLPLPVDEWNLDVVVTGSQKGWMVPPGLAMASVSAAAWQANAAAKMPRFYWDFGKAKKYLETGETPWTPAVSVVAALDTALDMMLKEGTGNIQARQKRLGEMARAGITALGLPLFADPKYASNTVTSVAGASGLDINQLRKILREEYDTWLAGGQQTLGGKIFRIGHLGLVCEDDIREVLDNIKQALPRAGFTGK